MYDASLWVIEIKNWDVELLAVDLQLLQLFISQVICQWQSQAGSWGGVIHGCESAIGPADSQSSLPQFGECLWRGDLVHQVQIDIKDCRCLRFLCYDMSIPELLEESLWLVHDFLLNQISRAVIAT
jgi:hypothetical protein